MFAFVSEDENGNEGVVGMSMPDDKDINKMVILPLVGADLERIEQLTPYAKQISNQTGKTIRLITFGVRNDLLTITPDVTNITKAKITKSQ